MAQRLGKEIHGLLPPDQILFTEPLPGHVFAANNGNGEALGHSLGDGLGLLVAPDTWTLADCRFILRIRLARCPEMLLAQVDHFQQCQQSAR